MKRLSVYLLSLVLMLGLFACGTPEPTPEEPTQEPPTQEEPPVQIIPPTAEELAAQRIEDLLDSMTTEEKIGQLFGYLIV